MSLASPWALLGLLLLPLLWLLERLRRRPRALPWPSLLLWEGVTPAAAPARRRPSLLLLLECSAAALLSLAAAGPALVTGAAARNVVVLVDTGRHMDATRDDGTTARAATRAELDCIRSALAPGDRWVEFEAEGDLATEAAALPEADLRVLATNRPGVEGTGYVVVGRASHGRNAGIDAVEVRGDRLWFALAADREGPDEVVVRVGAEMLRVPVGRGFETGFVEELALEADDSFAGDDRVTLRRFAMKVRDETASPFVRAALLDAGTPAAAGEPADLVVTDRDGTPVAGLVRGADCIARGVFEGLFLDECAWRGARVREGDGELVHGEGALARWLDEKTLWLGLPLDRDWDDHGTLALVVERAKRRRAEAVLRPGEALAGDAAASPAPGLVDTRSVDRPWNGTLPEPRAATAGRTALRAALALAAAAILVVYLRAIVQRR